MDNARAASPNDERGTAWTWVIGVALIAHAASFFLPVLNDRLVGRMLGWEAAWGSFMSMLEAGWNLVQAAQNPTSYSVFDLWLPFAWLGNLAWPAALVRVWCPPRARWRPRAARAIATAAALVASVGLLTNESWSTGFWTWIATIWVAVAAVWTGPRRTFGAGCCRACGYDCAGVSVCPECGAEALPDKPRPSGSDLQDDDAREETAC